MGSIMELDAQINQWIIDLPILQKDSNSTIQLKQLCSMSQYVRDSIAPVSYTHLRAPRDGLLSRMPSSA